MENENKNQELPVINTEPTPSSEEKITMTPPVETSAPVVEESKIIDAKPLTPEEIDAEFQRQYKILCKTFGRSLAVDPVWILRDDGTYSMKIISKITRTNG